LYVRTHVLAVGICHHVLAVGICHQDGGHFFVSLILVLIVVLRMSFLYMLHLLNQQLV